MRRFFQRFPINPEEGVVLTGARGVVYRIVTILLFGLIIGTIGSFLAVGFVEAIQWLDDIRRTIRYQSLLGVDLAILLIPVMGGLLVGGLVHFLMSSRRAVSLTDLILLVQTKKSRISLRRGTLDALAAIIGMGSGASIGPYGPLATMGATIGGNISRLSRADATLGIGCGVAAAISTAFSAPIAAIIFVHEVILRHYSLRSFAPITVASSTGFFISNYLLGRPPLFRVIAGRSLFAPEILAFVIIGILGALVAVITMKAIMAATNLAQGSRFPQWARPAIAGAAIGVMGQWVPEAMGVGKDVLTFAITEDYYTANHLVLILLMKIAATAICIGFGFVGGVFSPALVIGILSGALFGQGADLLYGDVSSGVAAYAICGMMAVTSPVIGAPLTAILIVFELTRNYELTTAVMVSVVFSNVVAYRLFGRSLFDRQLVERGYDLSLGRDKVILQEKSVSDLVTTEAVLIKYNQTLADAYRAMLAANRQECYVVDELFKYKGRLQLFDILRPSWNHVRI